MFDTTKSLFVDGTLAKVEWVNPHTFVWLYVEKVEKKDKPGEYDLYAFENGPITMLMRNGWTKDTLEIARRVVAPDALTAPAETTFVYLRDRDHVFHEASHCSQDDRSINRETGEQQFDLTPPSDLPPPPH